MKLGWGEVVLGQVLLGLALVGVPACGQEDGCPECQREKCSDLVNVCEPDPDCACMSDCVAHAGIPGVSGCLDECGLTERPPAFGPLEECMATACPDSEDECSTPDDYSPPERVFSNDTTIEGLGGGDLGDCSFDPDLTFDPEGSVLQLQSEDENLCVRLERRNDGAGGLANTNWTLLSMRVGPLGSVANVEDQAALCYYSSHHNFLDWAHAWTGTTRHDLELQEDGHNGSRLYVLHTFEQGPIDPDACAPVADGSGPIGGAIQLFPVNP